VRRYGAYARAERDRANRGGERPTANRDGRRRF